jgi:hypothetical protein
MDLDIKGIENMERMGRDNPKAAARALNNTMRHVRTQMVKDARTRYKISAADMKQGMGDIMRASFKNLSAIFRASGRRVTISRFVSPALLTKSLAQAGRKISARPTIKAKIIRGSVTTFPRAFAANVKTAKGSEKTLVFWRTKTGSLKAVTGPSMPDVLNGTWQRIKGVREKLFDNLAHEIEWMNSKRK